jgi:MFS family permease
MTRSERSRFRRLWWSNVASSSGVWASHALVSWVVLQATSDVAAVSLVFAIRTGSALLLGVPAGAIADKVDRIRLVRFSNVILAVMMAILGIIPRGYPMPLVAVALLLGAAEAVRLSATQALAFEWGPNADGFRGLAGIQLSVQVAGLSGGAAAVLLAALGPGAAFGATSAVFVLAAVLLGRASAAVIGSSSRDSLRRLLGGALQLVVRNSRIRSLATLVAIAEAFGYASEVLIPIFAATVLHAGPSGFGALLGVKAVGGGVGALVIGRMPPRGAGASLFAGALGLFGAALVAFALNSSFGLALLLLALTGIAGTTIDILAQFLLQEEVPDASRGRAAGIWVFGIGAAPIGGLILGVGARGLGPQLALGLSGGLLVCVAIGLTVVARRVPDLLRDQD